MSGPAARRLVTRDDIRRFAVAVGSTAPVHHDADAARALGHPDLLAPPFYFTTLGLSLGKIFPASSARPDGLARDEPVGGRVVAGGGSVEWFGDIHAGDELTMEERFLDERTTRGRDGEMTIARFERIYAVGGEPRVREVTVRIGRLGGAP